MGEPSALQQASKNVFGAGSPGAGRSLDSRRRRRLVWGSDAPRIRQRRLLQLGLSLASPSPRRLLQSASRCSTVRNSGAQGGLRYLILYPAGVLPLLDWRGPPSLRSGVEGVIRDGGGRAERAGELARSRRRPSTPPPSSPISSPLACASFPR